MRPVKQIGYNRSSRNGTKIKYIVIHDTGNTSRGANANAHYRYFNSGTRNSSADFFVDDKEILCVNDYYKYYTWHCGDGDGKYEITNSNSIGIEMCVNSDGDYGKTLEHTFNLIRELMVELNISIDRVVRHYDASRKNCPASMSKNNWSEWTEFKNRLKSKEDITMSQYEELKKMIEDLSSKINNPETYNFVATVPSWAKPTIQKLHDSGSLKGDGIGLNLNYDMLRILVILDRAGVFK